ncbi:hypothetical protein HDU88_004265, partial [Geranomyces variabilis]
MSISSLSDAASDHSATVVMKQEQNSAPQTWEFDEFDLEGHDGLQMLTEDPDGARSPLVAHWGSSPIRHTFDTPEAFSVDADEPPVLQLPAAAVS